MQPSSGDAAQFWRCSSVLEMQLSSGDAAQYGDPTLLPASFVEMLESIQFCGVAPLVVYQEEIGRLG